MRIRAEGYEINGSPEDIVKRLAETSLFDSGEPGEYMEAVARRRAIVRALRGLGDGTVRLFRDAHECLMALAKDGIIEIIEEEGDDDDPGLGG